MKIAQFKPYCSYSVIKNYDGCSLTPLNAMFTYKTHFIIVQSSAQQYNANTNSTRIAKKTSLVFHPNYTSNTTNCKLNNYDT